MAYHGKKNHRLLSRMGLTLLVGMALQVAVATAPAWGEEPPPIPVAWPIPGGVLALEIPGDWESNPRLASDNGTTGFLHPSGMKIEQAIPVWIVVEHRLLDHATFDDFLVQCLEEGNSRGFVFQERVTTETTDGHQLLTYSFNPSENGEPRRLSFLQTPQSVVLLRQQAADPATWDVAETVIDAILKSLRFTVEGSKE